MAKLGDFRIAIIGEDKLTRAATTARRSTQKLTQSTGGLQSSLKNLRTSVVGVQSAFSRVMPYLTTAGAIFAGYKLTKGIFDTATAFEKMQFQLRGVSKTIREADADYKMIRKFAYDTPHMTDDVTKAFIMLKAVGLEPTARMMSVMGDAAFAMGMTMEEVSTAYVSGMAIPLRRLGIEMNRTGKTAIITSGDMRYEVENNMESLRRTILDIWEKKYPGAMDKAKQTTIGSVAIMKSAWAEFEDALGTALLPTLTKVIVKLTDLTNIARQSIMTGKTNLGIEIPEREYLETRIRSLKEEIKGLESIVGSATERSFSWWSSLNQAFMGKGGIEEGRKRVAELRAELRLYSQRLESLDQQSEQEQKNREADAEAKRKAAAATRELARAEEYWAEKRLEAAIAETRATDEFVGLAGTKQAAYEFLKEAEDERAATEKYWHEKRLEYYIKEQEALDAWLEDWDAFQAKHGEIQNQMAIDTKLAGNTMQQVMGLVTGAIINTVAATTKGAQSFREAMRGMLRSLASAVAGMAWAKMVEAIAKWWEHNAKMAEAIAEYNYAEAALHQTAASAFMMSAVKWGAVGAVASAVSFLHKGGVVGRGGLRSDEALAVLQAGEGVLSRQGVTTIGGEAGVNAINRGESPVTLNVYFSESGGIHQISDAREVAEVIGQEIMSTLRESA